MKCPNCETDRRPEMWDYHAEIGYVKQLGSPDTPKVLSYRCVLHCLDCEHTEHREGQGEPPALPVPW